MAETTTENLGVDVDVGQKAGHCAVCGRKEYRWGIQGSQHWLCFSVARRDFEQHLSVDGNMVYSWPNAPANDVVDSVNRFINTYFGGEFKASFTTVHLLGDGRVRRYMLLIQRAEEAPMVKSANKT